MNDTFPMTRQDYERLKAQLDELESVEEPKLSKAVAVARAAGDLKENAEYHGARESLGMLQAKINQLKSKISRAQIVDMSTLPKDEVVFGCTVVVKDLDFGDTEEFTLVGVGSEDYDAGKINITSPLAQGLVGKKVGDVAEIDVPAGITRFEVVEIRFDPIEE